jgi:hypothetical protein
MVQGPDMSDPETGYVRSRDRICLKMVIVTRLPGRISLAKDIADVIIEMTRHVRSRSQTCPVLLTRTQQRTQISPED